MQRKTAPEQDAEDVQRQDAQRIQDNYRMLENIERRLKGYLGYNHNGEPRSSDALTSDRDRLWPSGHLSGPSLSDNITTKSYKLDHAASPPTKERRGSTSLSPTPLLLNAPDYSFKKSSKEALKTRMELQELRIDVTETVRDIPPKTNPQDTLSQKIKAIDAKINQFKQENISFNQAMGPDIYDLNSGRSSNLEMAVKSQINAFASANSRVDSTSNLRSHRDDPSNSKTANYRASQGAAGIQALLPARCA